MTRPTLLLRLEGLAALLLSLLLYQRHDGSWWWWLLFLAPDLAALGYLAGNRVGAATYNSVHTYVLPAILGAIGLLAGAGLAVSLALVWAGHIAADRALAYGLKFPTAFKETHLSGGQAGPS